MNIPTSLRMRTLTEGADAEPKAVVDFALAGAKIWMMRTPFSMA